MSKSKRVRPRLPGSKQTTCPAPFPMGYRMPAEWEPHAATWLAWPHYQGDWPGKFEPIPWVYAEIIRNLAKHERVELIVNGAAGARQARRVLERGDAFSSNIRFHRWATNRVWLRDSGCIFLNRPAGRCPAGQPRAAVPPEPGQVALKFRFNAWAKYSNWRHDEKIGSLMAKAGRSARREFEPCPRGERDGRSRADRSTSTERARFSRLKNAYSARCRNAIRTWRG